MNAPFDVAVASDMCVDLILAGNVRPQFGQVEQIVDSYHLELGGSANIFACQMAKLGARTAVIGKVGPDQFGEFVVKRLKESQVDCSHVRVEQGLRTGLGVTLAEPSDRAILTFLGSITAVKAADLPTQAGSLCKHWHIASYFLLEQLRPMWSEFLRRSREGGVTTSLDTNWDPENRWDGIQAILPLIDVFLPNAAEAKALTGEADVLTASKALSRLGPLVVTKCGEEGAVAVRGEEIWRFDPGEFPEGRIEPVDTVGAGDNFDAGFLRCWIAGAPMKECLRLGHRCAVSSLLAPGGIGGQLVTVPEPLRPEASL